MEGGSRLCDCSLSAPPTAPSTEPSSRCMGMVKVTRASPVPPATSSDTWGLPSARVRRSTSRSAGSSEAAPTGRPPRRFSSMAPSLPTTCTASKKPRAGSARYCRWSSKKLESCMRGVTPAAMVRNTFWLCSILLASRRAITSTSSVCCATTRRIASWPDTWDTCHAAPAPASTMAHTATRIMRRTHGPGMCQDGASKGCAGAGRGVMARPQRQATAPCRNRTPTCLRKPWRA